MQLMANNVSEVMSSYSRNPNPGYSRPLTQEANGERTFESGSRPPIHPQIMSYCVALSTRELQIGSSEAVISKSGSPLGPFSGFMASVRHSPTLYSTF